MSNYKRVFMLKLPYCTHPSLAEIDEDFRTKLSFRPEPSLALAALCAFIDKYKKYDYELKAVDINIEAYTEPGQPIDVNKYQILLEDFIKNNEYDVLCLSAMFVFNERWVRAAVELSKQFHRNAKIIIGGGYPTLFPKRCLQNYDVDDVVIGEGEATLLHILNKYNNFKDCEYEENFSFSGYGTKNDKQEIKIIEKGKGRYVDISDVPAPAWHYLNIKEYFRRSGSRNLPIEATRGCPFRCSFCSTNQSWGLRVRYKPYQDMINEMLELKEKYDIETLSFIDDNLTFSKEWIMQFLRRIIEIKLPIKLTASNFSVKRLDEEIVDLLVEAGFHSFGIAVETGSPEMQKKINKNLDFTHIRKMVGVIKSYKDVHLHINWMVGFPNETIEQINQTFDFARELEAHSNQFLAVLPYPGTQLFDEAKSANLLIFNDEDLDKFDCRKCDYLKSNEWNYEQLQGKIYDINIELNFLKNPLLKNEEGKKEYLKYLEGLLQKLPEHIIANIIAGYLYKESNAQKYKEYYEKVVGLLEDEALCRIFSKYLTGDHYILKDFNEYAQKTKKQLGESQAGKFFEANIGDK